MVRYFISDLHLSDKRLDLIQAFVHLTDELCQRSTDTTIELYILGDFFEAYIGDDYQPEWIQRLDQQLIQLSEYGVAVYFIAGNRDFLVGSDWLARTGVIELSEQSVLDDRLLITHGDEFCVDDHAYQEFRAMVRQPIWQQQVLAMPLDQRIALAEKLRNDSQNMSADKSEAIMDVNREEITRVLPSQVALLIHGHTHRPALHDDEHPPRLVLGDWDNNVWVAIQSAGAIAQRTIATSTYLDTHASLDHWPISHQIALPKE